jgi:hypothetical protein
LPAPAPEQRTVIPAPAPNNPDASSAVPAPAAPGSAVPAPDSAGAAQAAAGAQPLQDSALQAGALPADANANAPIPLSQGMLSDPYQAQVPAQPLAQTVLYPPPAPLVETRPYPPQRNYVWISGWWWWGPANWVWVPGYWSAPYYGYNYLPGSWYWSSGYWRYNTGGWCRPGSSVISYNHFSPRPSTTVSVRAFTPHRVVSVGPVASTRSVHSGGAFQPRSSPLYPSTHRSVQPSGGYRYDSGGRYNAPSGGYQYGSGGVGRVVSPNSAVRQPVGYGSSYGDSHRVAPSTTYRGVSPGYRSSDSYGGGGRSYSGGSSTRSYDSGGSRSYGGGGGGRSYGGGGGGGGRMSPMRVSPGGGGGGGHGGGGRHGR